MTTRPLPRFGDLLREHRQKAGLTQEQLAERAGVSCNAVATHERGVARRPREATLRLLADALALAPPDRTFFEAAAHRLPPSLPTPDLAPVTPVLEEPATGSRGAEAATVNLGADPAPDQEVPVAVRVAQPPAEPAASPFFRSKPAIAAGLLLLLALLLWGLASWSRTQGGQAAAGPTPEPSAWYVAGGVQLDPLSVAEAGRLVAAPGKTITATFRVRNASLHPETIQGLAVGVRRPTDCANVWNGTAYDFPPVVREITLQPGEEFLYQRAWSLNEPGVYFMEPLKLGNDKAWGGIQPYPRIWFTVTDPRTGQLPPRGCLTPVPTP